MSDMRAYSVRDIEPDFEYDHFRYWFEPQMCAMDSGGSAFRLFVDEHRASIWHFKQGMQILPDAVQQAWVKNKLDREFEKTFILGQTPPDTTYR